MDHFKNPRNIGEMEDADALGEADDPICNDLIYVYIKVKDEKIIDISYQTFGCAIALASSSILTELAKGKSLEEAMNISEKDLVDALNGVPIHKTHSINLAIKGLRAAIKNYYNKS